MPDPAEWDGRDVTFRLVRRAGDGMPDETDLRELHEVLEGSFVDHFNHWEETFEEFLHRLREDPGHRWDHWWLAELTDGPEPQPVGALIGTVSESPTGPSGSYVSYIGVLEAARGVAWPRACCARSSPTPRPANATASPSRSTPTHLRPAGLYTGMGWETAYITQSWHRDVPVD